MKKLKLLSCIAVLLLGTKINAQVSSLGNGSPLFPPAPFVGWDGTGLGGPRNLDIKNNYAARDINFFTNQTGVNGSSVNRMVIKGSGATAGFVGVGTTAAPSQKFEVEAGNINLFTSTNAYMIGSQNILWHKGNARNIFVGVGAGANHVGGASNNSYVGYNAGFSGGGGLINDENTIFGADAGFSNTARAHVFVGYRTANAQSAINSIGLTMVGAFAGEFGTGNGESVFVGYKAGRNTNSSSNTFVGFLSGENNTGGGANSFFGYNSGNNNGTHTDNTYLGGGSGVFSNGNNNTCVGRSSGASGVGNSNVLLGYFAMQLANSGDENVIIGSKANSSTSGNNYNTMVGTQAGLINTIGAKNTFIGY